MIKKIALALAIALFSGCALLGTHQNCEPTKLWQKEGATPSEFYVAKFTCLQQSQFNGPDSQVGVNWQSFNECMKAFGYTPAE